MLVDSLSGSFSIYTPNFTHSSKLENLFENVLCSAIPDFLYGLNSFPKTKQMNEEDFSQEFTISLSRYLSSNSKGIITVQDFRDFYTIDANPVKRVDFAFVSSEQGAIKNKLYTVEAKRLPTGLGSREKEYVFGFFSSGSSSGGIQRFKTGDHGYGLSKGALLGYVEEKSFSDWHNTINSWIVEKAKELPDEWSESEQLQEIEIDSNQVCSFCRSSAKRVSDSISLFHLWIKIPLISILKM